MMLKKKHVLTTISVAVMFFLVGTMLNMNLTVSGGRGKEGKDEDLWKAIDELQSQIDNLNATLTSRIEDLEGQMTILQNGLEAQQTRIDSLNTLHLELQDRVNALELNQSLLAERIAVLEDEVERLKGTESTFFFDKFETGLDNWSYWGDLGYSLAWVSNTARISGDGYPGDGGMQKVVDLSEWNGSGSLLLSFDWRATSDTAGSVVTNAALRIEDADSHSILLSQSLAAGGTVDTGWQNYTNDISSYVLGHNRIRIILYLDDGWVANYHQTNSYDNIKLTNATSP